MGIYINPGNRGFAEINTPNYVDKTGLISLISQTIGSENKLTCCGNGSKTAPFPHGQLQPPI